LKGSRPSSQNDVPAASMVPVICQLAALLAIGKR
jgi:hypothetical protein